MFIDPDGMQVRPGIRRALIAPKLMISNSRRIRTNYIRTTKNQITGSRVKKHFFEPRKSTTDPQINSGNKLGASLTTGLNFADAVITLSKDINVTANGKTTIINNDVQVVFSTFTDQQKFDEAQQVYEAKLNTKIAKLDSPELPQDNTKSEWDRYFTDAKDFETKKLGVKISMGSSPKEKAVNEIKIKKDKYNTSTTVTTIPEFRQAN